jgi:hypothetical protein
MKKLLILLFFSIQLFGQKTQIYTLTKLHEQGKLKYANRSAKVETTGNKSYIKLSDQQGEGLVWLPISSFKNGEIEIEMQGKDVFQRSFIGIAFHGLNDSTYDAVYCRPFNFYAKDSIRKIHAIQYVSHPNYTWKKLREERNGQFEKEISNAPDPNSWFKMKINVEDNLVKAYINNAINPSLIINKLNDRTNGKIGIFVGDNSDGNFSSIKVRNSKF